MSIHSFSNFISKASKSIGNDLMDEQNLSVCKYVRVSSLLEETEQLNVEVPKVISYSPPHRGILQLFSQASILVIS